MSIFANLEGVGVKACYTLLIFCLLKNNFYILLTFFLICAHFDLALIRPSYSFRLSNKNEFHIRYLY